MTGVAEEKCDISFPGMSIMESRLNLIDYSIPTLTDHFVVLMRKPLFINNYFAFLSPFSLSVWILILISLMATTCVISISNK